MSVKNIYTCRWQRRRQLEITGTTIGTSVITRLHVLQRATGGLKVKPQYSRVVVSECLTCEAWKLGHMGTWELPIQDREQDKDNLKKNYNNNKDSI